MVTPDSLECNQKGDRLLACPTPIRVHEKYMNFTYYSTIPKKLLQSELIKSSTGNKKRYTVTIVSKTPANYSLGQTP